MAGVAEWSTEEVLERIAGLPWVDGALLASIKEHEIDGAALLEVTKDDIKEDFAVKELGRVKRILRGIAQLEEAPDGAPCPRSASPPRGASRPPSPIPPPHKDSGAHVEADPARVDLDDRDGGVPSRARSPSLPSTHGLEVSPDTDVAMQAMECRSDGGTPPAAMDAMGGGVIDDLDGDILAEDLRPHPPPRDEGTEPRAARQAFGTPRKEAAGEDAAARAGRATAGTPNPMQTDIPRPTPPPKRPHTAMAAARRHSDTGLCRLDGTDADARLARRPATSQGWNSDTQKRAYSMGILENERRYAELCDVYKAWRGCMDASSKLTLANVVSTLKIYFSLTVEEAVAMSNDLRKVVPHSHADLQPEGFAALLSSLTVNMPPAHFDHLKVYLSRCIHKTAGVQEQRRRERLVEELFRMWDYDHSDSISSVEYTTVIQRFNEVSCDVSNEEEGAFCMARADRDGNGVLDLEEFSTLLLGVWEDVSPNSFDLKYLRLCRAVEDVILCNVDASGRRISAKALGQIVSAVMPTAPIILHGIGADPSRSVEECAQAFGVKLKPVLVTHRTAEAEAVRAITRYGIGRGCWVYIVVGKKYNADALHREIGRILQTTNTWMVHPKFRLLISSPTRSTAALPSILTMHAVQASTVDCDVERLLMQITATQGPWRVSFSSQQRSADGPWNP
eukprot:TRINITY_DN22268_c0_g1_i1.p1 TRINITY_DN22268_c0_g1~~TRINITY_DN22268_c0_g1_i1.p1  ORF type:complete len:678 (+),score=211.85 TRINITY_DN22268_c0_g1_i1:78-2111(+)